jgi:hypothetical protein
MKTASSSIQIKPYAESHKDQLIQMILKIQNLEFSIPVTLPRNIAEKKKASQKNY